MFYNKNNLIESSFDITKENNYDDENNPYFIDMKLDICIPNGDKPYIMDEDELKEALDLNIITESEYNSAFVDAHKIIDIFKREEGNFYKFIWSQDNKFNKKTC